MLQDEIDFIPKYDPYAKNNNDGNIIKRELSFHSPSDVFIVRQKTSNDSSDGVSAAAATTVVRDRQVSNITDNTIIGST
jgi:hypothetical protein